MNKLLKVPDENLKDIKILAAMNDISVKKYLENLLAKSIKEEIKKKKNN